MHQDDKDTEALAQALSRFEAEPQYAPPPDGGAEHVSPMLALLDPDRRPDPMPVCGHCPQSLWFSGPKMQCFCRAMHVITWDSEDPHPITVCDGMLLEDQE